MIKQVLLVVIFLTLTPIALGTSLFALLSMSAEVPKPKVLAAATQANLVDSPRAGVRVYASLPSTPPTITGEPITEDARPEIVRDYLNRYDSPLLPYANFIVATADKYQLDYRLITAIAQQESNLCKKIPPETNNCWGWGIHSAGTLGFSSYSEGIETVSQGLRQEYLNKGYTTIEEIMSKYTPLSNGSWAEGVNKFMGEMI